MGFQAVEPPISDCRPQTGKFQRLGIVQNEFQTVGTALDRRLRSYVIRGHRSNGLESTRTHWTNKFRSSPLEPRRTVGLEPHRTPREKPKASPCNSWRFPKAWNFTKYFQDGSGRPEWCRPSLWNNPYFVGRGLFWLRRLALFARTRRGIGDPTRRPARPPCCSASTSPSTRASETSMCCPET